MKKLSSEELDLLTVEFTYQDNRSGIIGGYCETGYPLYYANDEIAEMLGYGSVEELIQAIDGKVVNTIHPDDLEQVERDLGNDYYEGMTYETTYRMPKKDGTWLWIVDKGKVVRAEDGRLAIMSMCTDMSQFVKRQKELETRNTVSDYMFRNLPGGYHRCAMDEGYPFLYVSERFLDLLGWSEKELKENFDNKFMNLVHPDDKDITPAYVERILSDSLDEPYQDVIYRLRCRDGYRWFSDTTMKVNVAGQSFFQGFITDISSVISERECKEAQLRQLLRDSEQRYQIIAALGKAYEEICVIDLNEQKYSVVSGVLEGRAGPLGQLTDFFAVKNISDEYSEAAKRFIDFSTIEARLSEHKLISQEFKSKGGKWFLVSFVVKKRDEEGKITHLLMTARNIDEQKEKEFEQQRLTELRLKTMAEAIHGGFKISRLDDRLTFAIVSDQFAAMLGYGSPEELTAASEGSMLGLIDPENTAFKVDQIVESIKAGEMYTANYRIRCKDGSWKSVEDKGRLMRNEAGEKELWSFVSDQDELVQKSEALEIANNENKILEKKQVWTDGYYKNLLDMLNCGVMSYTIPDHRLLHMNAEALRIYGARDMKEAELIVRKVLNNAVYPDPTVIERLKRLYAEDGSIDFECILTNLKGKKTNIVARTEVYSTIQNERFVVTTFLDVSENMTLKKEKSILETLCSDYTSVYICDLEADSIVPINSTIPFMSNEEQRYEERFGSQLYKFSFRMKLVYDDLIVKESAPDLIEKMDPQYLIKYLSDHNRLFYRLRVRPNRSGYEHFELQMVRLQSMDGYKVIMGLRYIDDVIREEERQKVLLEDALAASNRKNEVIGSISKLYFQVFSVDLRDDTYKEVFADDRYMMDEAKHTGSAQRDSDKVMLCFVDKAYRPQLETFVNYSTLPERLADKETISMEYQSISGIWMSAAFIVQARDKNGKVIKVLFLMKQIDEEKRRELEYQKKLEQTAREAKLANEAKTNFLRRMSHDIRTPLNGIIGLLKINEAHFNDKKLICDNQKKMEASANHLLSLINDILQTSKLEDGKVILSHEAVYLPDLISDISNIIVVRATEAGIKWECEEDKISIPYPFVYGSPVHLRQIFLNIYGNCIKYNKPDGKITTNIEFVDKKENICVYKWIISDTGIGMSEEFLAHIFEPFTQAYNDAYSSHHGVGLGMSIVKGLLDQMNGKINITSEEGVGSTFEITIPFETAPPQELPAEQICETSNDIRGTRIMLVEDNELNAEIAKALLTDEGAEITVAADGQKAVELFDRCPPDTFDVILMDMMMPVMDGVTATKTIRALERPDAKSIPIIAMTANAFKDDEIKCIEAGMNAYLSKPLNVDKVKRMISAHTLNA